MRPVPRILSILSSGQKNLVLAGVAADRHASLAVSRNSLIAWKAVAVDGGARDGIPEKHHVGKLGGLHTPASSPDTTDFTSLK